MKNKYIQIKNQQEKIDFSFSDVCYFRGDLRFFSEPENLIGLIKQIIPQLRLKKECKVWLPFCESGEDAYTLSIIFHENKLLHIPQVLAGESDENKLIKALQGKFLKEDILRARRTYFFSGGKNDLLDYFIFDGEEAILKSDIRNKVTFNNNEKLNPVASDLIYLPNLLSRMDVNAQKMLLRYLKSNLIEGGYLVLGTYDTLNFSESIDGFEKLDKEINIWKKIF